LWFDNFSDWTVKQRELFVKYLYTYPSTFPSLTGWQKLGHDSSQAVTRHGMFRYGYFAGIILTRENQHHSGHQHDNSTTDDCVNANSMDVDEQCGGEGPGSADAGRRESRDGEGRKMACPIHDMDELDPEAFQLAVSDRIVFESNPARIDCRR